LAQPQAPFVPTSELIAIAVLGAISGLMIGCVGIGGVILVPAMVFLLGIPIEAAIPLAMLAFIASGLVAMTVFAHGGTIRWDMATWLCIGATPAAVAGAWGTALVNPLLLQACVGGFTLMSGINALRKPAGVMDAKSQMSKGVLLSVGVVTGFLSSLTGSGGPLVLVPILIAFEVAALTAVGLSQVIQLPIAIAATAANLHSGSVDLVFGGVLAASLSVGSLLGAKLAHVAPRETLRRIVSVLLVLVGLFVFVNIGLRLMR
jgi:uncharacterized protein